MGVPWIVIGGDPRIRPGVAGSQCPRMVVVAAPPSATEREAP
ncbi:hypothetical protein [Arthrobacter sp. FW306-2-2C-D06B]|nr:hypothetical protein [Arthrobacter sp. FW306-2-2C-D06B]